MEGGIQRHQGLVDRHQELAGFERQRPLVTPLAQGGAKGIGTGVVARQAELVAADQLTHLRKKQNLDHACSPLVAPSWK